MVKSIHPDTACFLEVDQELLRDTQHIMKQMNMDMIGTDYIICNDGSKQLLEVNHIPNITCFEEVRLAYLETVINWISK